MYYVLYAHHSKFHETIANKYVILLSTAMLINRQINHYHRYINIPNENILSFKIDFLFICCLTKYNIFANQLNNIYTYSISCVIFLVTNLFEILNYLYHS